MRYHRWVSNTAKLLLFSASCSLNELFAIQVIYERVIESGVSQVNFQRYDKNIQISGHT